MLAVALLSFAAPAVQAQDAAYVVSYFETMPAAQNEAAALVRGLGEASRKDAGNLRFDVLQRISQPNHFAIIEAWKDAAAQSLHMAGAHVKQFREKLQPLLRSPYDERPHAPMNVGSAQLANATRDAVYVVTHVDFIPPEKENGIAMVKSLAESSRKDDGNLRFEGLQQISRPNHLTLVEVWKDSKALDNHGVTPHMKSFREKLSPVSGSLFDERLYKSIN
jgi:quinol monooxygenase YgiN